MGTTDDRRRSAGAARDAAVLERRLGGFRGDLTVADAAARGGLALRDAESALFHLSSEYRGHLKATEKGDLVFSFPDGLRKPPERSALRRATRAVGRALAGAGRFLVRAWVSIVFVGYAVVLAAVLIAWALKDDRDGLGDALAFVLRLVLEALYWTFHPFSPVMWQSEPPWLRTHGRGRKRRMPFYEKVNRFVFGPPKPVVDPRDERRAIAAEIRRLGGRVGPADVMRVTGKDRAEAEALLCRAVLDYDGEIDVSADGAVVYRFPALRLTAIEGETRAPLAVWERPRVEPPPLTGNEAGTNVLLGAVNGFNLAASGWAWSQGMTLDRVADLLAAAAGERLPPPPAGDTPLVLGAVPFVFSAAIFVLPAARAIRKGAAERRAAAENGRRALLREVVTGARELIPADVLRAAWQRGGGQALDEATLTAEVRRLGGEPDVDEHGRVVYRFTDVAHEARALAAERAAAPDAERRLGAIEFSSRD